MPKRRLRATCWLGQCAILIGLTVTACSGPKPFSNVTTDLFLADLWSDRGLVVVGDPWNMTNREGYDNQPVFLPDGKSVLFSSRDARQADIFRFDFEQNQTQRLTRTVDREYSPQPLPNGGGFSAVRYEPDDRVRLWRFDETGDEGVPLLPSLREPLLYYTWVNATQVAIRLDDEEASLHLANVETEKLTHVANQAGRSIARIPNQDAISFVHKETAADWWIKRFDLQTGEVQTIARTVQGQEDHAWLPAGGLIMGQGSKLYLWSPKRGSWHEISDFADHGLRNISRVAISPNADSLIVVAESG